MRKIVMLTALVALAAAPLTAAKAGKKGSPDTTAEANVMSASTFAGLKLRSIGPAVTSGRIVDLAVDPDNPAEYWVAAASGGVWKTVNGGATFSPMFDGEGSYSIGCLAMDPDNSNVVWVGTGENNSQRSVSWGDGVYVTRDGGKSWKNVGLKRSEHIGRILVDPRDSDVVYVAAQGPLWSAGGDRGLYKTTDGGETWTAILTVSDDTGVTDVVMNPADPDELYAASYQRRRHVWTLIDGGPETAIYRSTDAGTTWHKVTRGLPKGDMGRIGLAVSPADRDVVYAIIETAEDRTSGVYRSDDRGESWTRRSSYVSGSGQYYNELVVDPHDVDRVYSMDTRMMVSDDGGSSFHQVGEADKHVDNHALWIDPRHTDHLRAGCDGGVYESFDRGTTWIFTPNLPVTQFYKLAVDSSEPFYYVYGGTQDNFSLGGPSRTTASSGITNYDWFVTRGGDGFQSQVDPEDPNIVYAESQYGGLVRYDRASGERTSIEPQEGPDEAPNRWNWDSPLIISPHSHTRLYFASQRVYRSNDRGDTWTAVSGDLSRQLDRNALPVMGRVWPVDAVAKNASTSFYGNVTALNESPLVEGLLYAGTDDGLVQVSEDGGASWRAVGSFPGVPDKAYVAALEPSQHQPDTVYAAFDNHKMGDFTPYLLRSDDRGRTWTSVASDLPAGNVVWALAEDHVEPRLLFAGCEFGVYFTVDAGAHWIELTGGMPTIAVRDLVIQKRENDLVLATFGRGFYVLDDYTPLRHADAATLEAGSAVVFPVKDALAYIPSNPFGYSGKGFQGAAFYTADNPPYGAVLTYYLPETLKTRAQRRHDAEKKAVKKGDTPPYPSDDELRAEAREEKPTVVVTVSDADGNVVRRLTGPASKGIHRVAWNLRYPSSTPAGRGSGRGRRGGSAGGPLAVPGTYSFSIAQVLDGVTTELAEPVQFTVRPLDNATLPAADRDAMLAFYQKVARLQRAVMGAANVVSDTEARLEDIRTALFETPAAGQELTDRARALDRRLEDIRVALRGDRVVASHNEPTPPSIMSRVGSIVYAQYSTTSAPTTTMKDAYRIAGEQFTGVLADLRQLVAVDLAALEADMDAAGAPHTPGRLPEWSME